MPALPRIIVLAGAVAMALGPVQAMAAETIGVNAAVNPDSTGAPPGSAPQLLAPGQPVVFQERIATAANGQTQILFRDESTVSVGPDSDLVIDQFVYDPNAGTGRLAMSATKGVFRFVGGQVSKLGSPVTLTTPTATMGIRGGIFIARIASNGDVTAVFVYGDELTVTGRNGAVTTVRRPGFAVSVARGGNGPSAPFAAPRELLNSLVGQFDGTAQNRSTVRLGDSRIAGEPLFARLSAGAESIARTGGFDGGGLSAGLSHAQAAIDNLRLGTVAVQGDGRLVQVIRAFCQRRGRC